MHSERRFEFSDETSQKFRAIEVAGDTVTVRFGKIGTAGAPRANPSPEAAAKDAAKSIAEKMKKGYIETGAAPSTAAPTPAVGRGRGSAPGDATGGPGHARYFQGP